MNDNDGIAVRVNNSGSDNCGNHNMSHCNGGHTTLTPDLDFRRIKSMEEVTCKLKGIKVGLDPIVVVEIKSKGNKVFGFGRTDLSAFW